jgi:hypothetical protein
MPFDVGSPQFGINDGKIGTWTAPVAAGAATYVPPTGSDIMSIQMGQVSMELISAILTGDDRQTAIAASAIGGSVQMRWGGLNLSSLAILTGTTISSLSSSAKQLQIIGSQKMPYIGVILKALSAETGDTWIWLPKCKIMSGFTLAQMEYGAFTIPEVTMQVVDDDKYGAINIITHVVDTPILAMPPGNLAPLLP